MRPTAVDDSGVIPVEREDARPACKLRPLDSQYPGTLVVATPRTPVLTELVTTGACTEHGPQMDRVLRSLRLIE